MDTLSDTIFCGQFSQRLFFYEGGGVAITGILTIPPKSIHPLRIHSPAFLPYLTFPCSCE